MGRLKYRILIALALLHLSLVTMGAASFNLDQKGPLGRALNYYGVLTGSGNSYGFFAPGITNQLRARFQITDQSGRKYFSRLESNASKEADLRVGNIIDQFQNSDEDDNPEDLQRSLSASLAGTLFGRNPEAKEVTVMLEEYFPVSMEEYRQGVRSQWTSLYQATFRPVAKRTP